MLTSLQQFWPQVAAALTLLLTLLTAAHAILNKRDVRAAVGWVGLIVIAPLVGALAYIVLGINRINRRAKARFSQSMKGFVPATPIREIVAVGNALEPYNGDLGELARLVDTLARKPLTGGNRVEPLRNGDEAYPAMLEAIAEARHSVSLCTYIFDNDAAGGKFVDALADATARGVKVRVLIDDVGARYSFPSVARKLASRGVMVARFLPTVLPWRFPYVNLRNHRKVMVVDGSIGFTGGLNIRIGHVLSAGSGHPVADLHFRLRGPVVGHLQQAFTEDWSYATKEVLAGADWFPRLEDAGGTVARGIMDGPDEDFEKLRWVLLGAVACARRRIRIVTPYFLPDDTLISTLNLAAMRGVKVDIVLPEANNLVMVKWASDASLWQLLEHGCNIYMTPAPFDHSKLLLVDDQWCLIGSGNWDARSLRLNFEFNVECYDRSLTTALDKLVEEKIAHARQLTLAEVNGWPVAVRLRNGIVRLFAPYL